MIASCILIFAPLVGFLGASVLGPILGNRFSQAFTIGLMFFACLISGMLFIDSFQGAAPCFISLAPWINVGSLHIAWELYFDSLSCLMILMVTFISLCIHIYSVGYMRHDCARWRFMAYLSLFTFMMFILVTADNLLQLFFGWEGVGLASYLLIGYWHEKPSANAAAIKAFIVNRVGDLAFIIGLIMIYANFQTLSLETLFHRLGDIQFETVSFFGASIPILEIICLLLFIGAMGKSAQIGLHTWLPDAMEGPTPVSALIHAATMVTAGVFMVVRLSHLYEMAPFTQHVIACVGALTAFYAGAVAITQQDLKRIIAYSTCSQLGYMFLAAGVSAYGMAMFHLITHAFFKALLFLGAGSIIHAMSDEQDIFKMGGIWKYIPFTYAMMWIGSLALAGIPFFAGYYSKHGILEAVWLSTAPSHNLILTLALVSIFLTAFYGWRLIRVVFHGAPRADEKVMGHIHEAPRSMIVPMFILALGSIFVGFIFNKLGIFTDQGKDFWQNAIAWPKESQRDAISPDESLIIQGCSLSGIIAAILLYGWGGKIPAMLAHALYPLYQFLLRKWYFDEIYALLIVRPCLRLASFFGYTLDPSIIDRGGPGNAAALTQTLSLRISRLHTGLVHHYALAMILGALILLTGYFFMSRTHYA